MKETKMSLSESIQKYKSIQEQYDRDFSDFEDTAMNRIPAEKRNLASIEADIGSTEMRLRREDSVEGVKKARSAINDLKEKAEDAVQLIDNLERGCERWRNNQSTRLSEIKSVSKEMWRLKRDDLISKLNFTPETISLLEDIVTATDGTDPGWKSRKPSDVVGDKLPEITYDSVKLTHKRLADEMGVPSIY